MNLIQQDAGRVVIARLGELKPQELASTVWGQVRCVFHNCCHDLFF